MLRSSCKQIFSSFWLWFTVNRKSFHTKKCNYSFAFLMWAFISCKHWLENRLRLHSYCRFTTAIVALIDFLETMLGKVQNLNDCTKRLMSRKPRKTACWTVAAGKETCLSIHSMKVLYWYSSLVQLKQEGTNKSMLERTRNQKTNLSLQSVMRILKKRPHFQKGEMLCKM